MRIFWTNRRRAIRLETRGAAGDTVLVWEKVKRRCGSA